MSPSPDSSKSHETSTGQASGPASERVRGLVRTHRDFVARSVRRLGVPESVADDVSQRVFLTATRKLESIEPHQERAYLFGIALRMASDARRATRRGRRYGVADTSELENLASSLGSPEELLDHKRRRELLSRMVGALPDRERTVFTLHEFDGLALSEIAERLELPPGTVASQLRRARLRFEGALKRLRARKGASPSMWTVAPLLLFAWFRHLLGGKRGSSDVTGATVANAPAVASSGGVTAWLALSAVGTSLALGGVYRAAGASHPHDEHAVTTTAASAAAKPLVVERATPERDARVAEPMVSAGVVTSAKARRAVPRRAGAAEQSAASSAAQPAATAPSLQRELSLLRAARAMLAAEDVVGALDLLERYRQMPGPHALAQEAQVLRVQALMARGARGEARAAGTDYLEQHPRSPQAPAVQRLVTVP